VFEADVTRQCAPENATTPVVSRVKVHARLSNVLLPVILRKLQDRLQAREKDMEGLRHKMFLQSIQLGMVKIALQTKSHALRTLQHQFNDMWNYTSHYRQLRTLQHQFNDMWNYTLHHHQNSSNTTEIVQPLVLSVGYICHKIGEASVHYLVDFFLNFFDE